MADGKFVDGEKVSLPHPAERPAQPPPIPTPSSGFFTTLFSPLYSSNTTRSPTAQYGDGRQSSTLSNSLGDHNGGGGSSASPSPTTATTPTTRLHSAETHSGPLHASGDHGSALQHSGNGALVEGEGGGKTDSATSSAVRQRAGFLPSRFLFANAAVNPREDGDETTLHSAGDGGALTDLGAVPSSSQRGNSGGAVSHRSSAGAGGFWGFARHSSQQQQQQQQQQEQHTAADASALQHGTGACGPHMLGYRQCLEVNPDFKTNCTWALDNYMRCKEDTEL